MSEDGLRKFSVKRILLGQKYFWIYIFYSWRYFDDDDNAVLYHGVEIPSHLCTSICMISWCYFEISGGGDISRGGDRLLSGWWSYLWSWWWSGWCMVVVIVMVVEYKVK